MPIKVSKIWLLDNLGWKHHLFTWEYYVPLFYAKIF